MMKVIFLFVVINQLLLHIRGQDDYVHYEEIDKFYKYHSSPNTWFEARRICESEGGILAMPENEMEATILLHHFNLNPTPSEAYFNPNIMLLGFHDLFEKNLFLTLKGDPLQNNFHNWKNGAPTNGQNENCGVMDRNLRLSTYDCKTPSIFMCEKTSINRRLMRKPSGYHCSGPNCYKLHLEPRTWVNALSICQTEGGNLAMVRSKSEQDQITRIFRNIPQFQINHLRFVNIAFIGLHDLFEEGEFITTQGETLEKIGYTNWARDQPNGKEKENCVAIDNLGKFHDVACDLATMFFCQRKKGSEIFKL